MLFHRESVFSAGYIPEINRFIVFFRPTLFVYRERFGWNLSLLSENHNRLSLKKHDDDFRKSSPSFSGIMTMFLQNHCYD